MKKLSVVLLGVATAALCSTAQAGIGHCYTFSNRQVINHAERICHANVPFTLRFKHGQTSAVFYLVHLNRGQRVHATLTISNPSVARGARLQAGLLGPVALSGRVVDKSGQHFIYETGWPLCGAGYGAPLCDKDGRFNRALGQLTVFGDEPLNWRASWGPYPNGPVKPSGTAVVRYAGVYEAFGGFAGFEGGGQVPTMPDGSLSLR